VQVAVEHAQSGVGRQAVRRPQRVEVGEGDLARRVVPGPLPKGEERPADGVGQAERLGGHRRAELQRLAHEQIRRPGVGQGQQVRHHRWRDFVDEDVADHREGLAPASRALAGPRVDLAPFGQQPVGADRGGGEASGLDRRAVARGSGEGDCVAGGGERPGVRDERVQSTRSR